MIAEPEPIEDEPFDSVEYLRDVAIGSAVATASDAPIVLFVAGGALSNKTAVLQQLIDQGSDLVPANPVVVDPELIRPMLPEWEPPYNAREPTTATTVRAEAIYLARQIVVQACAESRNLILVGIGAGEPGEFVATMQSFANAGYRVRVLFVDAPVEVELRRNDTRAAETGLRYDPATVKKLSIGAAKSFAEWHEQPWIARFEVYSTDTS